MQPPVIVIPGITASALCDEYATAPEAVWTMTRKHYERITLHPDDLRYEAREPARVRTDHLFEIPYSDFIAELRHDLAQREDEPVPVFPFAYDWRMPLALAQTQLAEFIGEVIGRTQLLRHYHRDAYAKQPQVDIVAHSMGGLIIAGYLSTSHDKRIRKVATLGTPYRGSFEAVLKVATGTAAIGPARQNSREREAARLTPALYHLIPSYEDAIITTHKDWENLFNATSWQPTVVETVAEQIRLTGVAPPASAGGRSDVARKLLQHMLDEAANHRATVEAFALEDAGLNPNDWMAVVGIGERTRTELRIDDEGGAPFFRLDGSERKEGYCASLAGDKGSAEQMPWETGDGTVPYMGARPNFMAVQNLVCVTHADFGYWEIRDRLIEGAFATLHGVLPAMNLVQKLVVAHLKGPAGGKGSAPPGIHARRAPDLPRDAPWDPPINGLQEKDG